MKNTEERNKSLFLPCFAGFLYPWICHLSVSSWDSQRVLDNLIVPITTLESMIQCTMFHCSLSYPAIILQFFDGGGDCLVTKQALASSPRWLPIVCPSENFSLIHRQVYEVVRFFRELPTQSDGMFPFIKKGLNLHHHWRLQKQKTLEWNHAFSDSSAAWINNTMSSNYLLTDQFIRFVEYKALYDLWKLFKQHMTRSTDHMSPYTCLVDLKTIIQITLYLWEG